MKLALVNDDVAEDAWEPFVECFQRHPISVVYGTLPHGFSGTCRVERLDQWEALLHETEVDCAVVTHSARLGDELAKIVQAGLPLVTLHPAASMLECFSLQMVQIESRSLIYPLVPDHDAGAIHTIHQWVSDGEHSPIGTIEQLSVERSMPHRDRPAVERQFGMDAFLLRRIIGSFEQLSAVGATPTDDDWTRLRVQLVSREGSPVSWSTVGNPSVVPGNLKLVGERGVARVAMHRYPRPWELMVGDDDRALLQETRPRANPLDEVEEAIANRETMESLWDDACRGLELADTIEYSLRRGKTVDMHEAEVTEAGTFRGVMAASGCLMLLGTLALTLLLAAIESIWSIGGPLRYVPWVVLASGMALFLALQLLSFALPKKEQADAS